MSSEFQKNLCTFLCILSYIFLILRLEAHRIWGYGMAVKGLKPTLVDTVDPPGPAFKAGIKPSKQNYLINTF